MTVDPRITATVVVIVAVAVFRVVLGDLFSKLERLSW